MRACIALYIIDVRGDAYQANDPEANVSFRCGGAIMEHLKTNEQEDGC